MVLQYQSILYLFQKECKQMKIKILGAGSAFGYNQYQSNFLLDFDGYKMLFDCGSDIRWALKEQGYGINDIDGIYISHLHADHIGGLEWVALNRFFNRDLPKVDLFICWNRNDIKIIL
jgi:ribonuclease BN (tRNA processing enzyme)